MKTYIRTTKPFLKEVEPKKVISYFSQILYHYGMEIGHIDIRSHQIISTEEVNDYLALGKDKNILKKGDNVIILDDFFIDEEFRGKRLGRKMIEHIIKKYDNCVIHLCCKNDKIDFYSKFGFKECLPEEDYFFLSHHMYLDNRKKNLTPAMVYNL